MLEQRKRYLKMQKGIQFRIPLGQCLSDLKVTKIIDHFLNKVNNKKNKALYAI